MSSKILVVDDDPQVARVLSTFLTGHGYEVRTYDDPEVAMANFEPWQPDLVISDLLMPRADGIELCRRVRRASQVPVIIISMKQDERTKVAAFDAGADDYLTKPFGMDEMLARVRVALRRGRGIPDASPLTIGEFKIDFHERRVYCKGQPVRLTPKEFDLFVFMARNPNRVLKHRTLLGAVWGEASEEQSEYLRVFVGQLRKKFESVPSHPRYLLTEPWVGYRFNPTGASIGG
jgi:two-component system KDP operon response regulator KdpE